MPFSKIKSGKNRGKYRSISGKIFTAKQVRLYYATSGFTKKAKKRKSKKKKGRKKRGRKS